MRLACAPSRKRIEALIKFLEKGIDSKGKDLNLNKTMQFIFDNRKKAQDKTNENLPENEKSDSNIVAAELVKYVPSILINSFMRRGIEVNIQDLYNKSIEFTNEETGLETIIKTFSLNLDQTKAAIQTNEKSKNIEDQNSPEEGEVISKVSSVRLKTFSPLSGSIIPFIKIDPNTNQIKIEKEDPHKKTIINTLNNLSKANQKDNGIYDFIFDGIRLKLKAVNLNKFANQKDPITGKKNINELDQTTVNSIMRSRKLKGAKLAVEGVIQENDRAILIITDQYGYNVRFNEDGRIVRDGSGKLVYQFLRSVVDGKVTDIYGREEQIADPTIIAGSLGISVEEAKARLNKELGILENLHQKVVKSKEDVLLDITGLTRGVSARLTGKKVKLNNLENLPGMTKTKAAEIVKSIEISPDDDTGIKSGFPYVIINGNPYAVDRPRVTQEIAEEIAEVLTKDIDTAKRAEFINQFLPARVAEYTSGRRNYQLTIADNDSMFFEIRNGRTIDLSPGNLSNITKEDKVAIVETLTKGWDGKGSPMDYKKLLLKTNSYKRFNIEEDRIIEDQDYIEFLGNQDIDITLNELDAGFYNQLIQFSDPDSSLQKSINKTVEKVDNRSSRKRAKDNLVKFFETNPNVKSISARVSSLSQARPYQDQRMALQNPLTGPTLSTVVRDVQKLAGLETGDTVELKIVTEEDPDFYPDTIGIYFNGEKIAVIAETDFSNEAEKEAFYKNQKQEEEIIKENISEEYKSDPLLAKTSDKNTNAADTFRSGKHFRKGLTLDKVTEKQIEDAKKWWANSPLSKFIEFEKLTNIVNSDQFASFVINAGALVDSNQPLGKIGITSRGTEVDIYHEAWHGFTQLFLSKKEKDALYAEIKKMPKYKNYTSFQIEELLAEDFRSYAKNPKIKKGRSKRNILFRKILDFIYKLLNKIPGVKINSKEAVIDMLSIPTVRELYDNLYLASSDPVYAEKIMNNYTPLVENTYWYELKRGIRRTDNAKFDALNDFDSNRIVEIFDSTISDITNEINNDRLINNAANPKAATLGVILNADARKETSVLVKERFKNKLENYYTELLGKTPPSFNNVKTLTDIKKNAVAVLKGAEGINDKYVFTRAQVNSFENLNADIEKGDRILGSSFRGVEIVSDYYTHKTAKIKNRPVEIIVVNKIEDAERQLYNYKKAGDNDYVEVTDIKSIPDIQPTSEQSKILNNIRMFQAAINNWGDESSGVIKYHRDNSRYSIINKSYNITNEALVEEQQEMDEILNPEEKDSSVVPDKSIGKKSLLQLAEKETLYVIGSLHKLDINGKPVFNEQGFRALVDFNKTFNIISNLIQGVKDPIKAYNILKDASEDFPVLKELIQYKLTDPALPINQEYDFDIVNAFFHTFKKARINYHQLTAFEENGKYNLAVTQSDLDVDGILREYREGFNAQPEGEYIDKTIDNQSVLKLQKVVTAFTDPRGRLKKDKGVEFLNALGINVDDIKRIREALDKDVDQFYGLNYIHRIVKGFGEIQQKNPNDKSVTILQKQFVEEFVKNPAKVLAKKIPAKVITDPTFKNRSINQYSQIKRIANLQAKFGAVTKNTGLLDAKGNLIFPVIQDSSASYLVDDLNSIKQLNNAWLNRQEGNTPNQFSYISKFNPEKNTFTKESIVLNSLFRIKDGGNWKKRKDDTGLEFLIASGVNITDSTKASDNTTNLNKYDKFSQDFHTFFLGGIKEFLRHGEKKAAYGLRVIDTGSNTGDIVRPQRPDGKAYDRNVYVDVDMFTPDGGGADYAINNMILPYLRSEFTRIKRFGENRDAYSQLTSYNKELFNGRKAGESFTMFDGMLTNDTKNKLYALPISSSVDLIDYLTKSKPELKEDIVKEIKEYFKNEASKTKEYAFTQSNYIDAAIIKKLNLPEINTKEKTKDQIEILKAERKALEIDSLLNAYEYNTFIHNFETIHLMYGDPLQFNYQKEDLPKRIGTVVGGGNNMILTQNAINWINGHFISNRDTYASLNGKPELVYGQTFNTDVVKDSEKKSIYIPVIEKAARAKMKKDFPKATKEEIQTYIDDITEEYKKMEESDGGGYISFDAYRMFKKASNKWSNPQEDLYQRLIKGEEINAEDVIEFFPIYKLAYYGDIANAPVTATAMHKFALTPLIPGVISQTLTDLHNKMMDEGIHYVTYGSGSKITALTKKPGELTDIFTDDTSSEIKEVEEGKKLFYPNVLYTKGLKEVTDVNTSYKSLVTFPTQQRPVLLDALVAVGDLIDSDNKDLYDNYKGLIRDYTKANQLEFLNDIGFEIDTDGNFIPIDGNLSKLMSVIKTELEKNEVPKSLRDLVDVTRTRKTRKVDLSIYPRPDDIEKLLMTLIQKRLVRYKVNGEALVQGPVTMWKDLWTTQKVIKSESEKRRLLGTNGLVFYTPGNAAHTAITMQGPFVNLLNLEDPDSPGLTIKDTGDIDRLNILIKDPKFREENREALTILGPRIPIDSPNSVEVFEVWHFLKPGGGNQIIVPTEIVAKAGSDFDVDKLNMMFPHIGNDGKVLKTKYSEDDIISEIERGEKQNTVLVEEYKRAKFNELLKVMRDILLLPDNYINLVKPNKTNLVENQVDYLQTETGGYSRFENLYDGERSIKGEKAVSPTTTMSTTYNLEKHDANLTGGGPLGVIALVNKMHNLYKSVNFKIPHSYTVSGARVNHRLLFDHNETDGQISLAHEYNKANVRISDVISHLLNALLDRGKLQYPVDLKATPEGINMVSYLIQAGVKQDEVFLYMNQPLIVEYLNEQAKLKGAFSKISGENTNKIQERSAENVLKTFFNKEQLSDILTNANIARNEARRNKKRGLNPIGTILKQNVPFSSYYMTNKYLNNTINEKLLKDRIKNNKDENPIGAEDLALFLNFLETEKGIKGFRTLQPIATPDTNYTKTLQELQELQIAVNRATSEGLESRSVNRLLNDSILTPFKIDRLAENIVTQAMPLRSSPYVRDFISEKLGNFDTRNAIKRRFGYDAGYVSRFSSSFNNAIINKLFQNSLSRFTDQNNNVVLYPKSYKGNQVEFVDGNPNFKNSDPVTVYEGKIYINKGKLKKQFDKQVFLNTNTTDEGHLKRGLDTFAPQDNPFPVIEDYIRYMMDVEYMKEYQYSINSLKENKDFKKLISKTNDLNKSFNIYISEKALSNTFNRAYVLGTTKYSYFNEVNDIINEFPNLKEEYPVLAQLAKAKLKADRKEKIFNLNNKIIVKGSLAEDYDVQLRKLGSSGVMKSRNAQDNERITNAFKKFSLMSEYQTGTGFHPYSLADIINPSQKVRILRDPVNKTIEQAEKGDLYLDNIFFSLLSSYQFQNYLTGSQIEVQEDAPAVDLDAEDMLKYFSDGKEVEVEEVFPEVVEEEIAQPATEVINIYAGTNENAELSNFAKRPVKLGDKTFRTPEGAFQAMKVWNTNRVLAGLPTSQENLDIIEKLKTATGAQAKALGRKITDLNQEIWDVNSARMMKNILILSFEQNPKALKALLATGNATLTHTQDKGKWGKEFPRILMEVREELKTTQPTGERTPKVIVNENGLIIKENAIDRQTSIDIVKDIKPIIEATSYKQTKGASSFDMGKRWTRVNSLKTPELIRSVVPGKQLNGKEITQDMINKAAETLRFTKEWPLYAYVGLDKNGKPLPNIPTKIIAILKEQGINISEYEASYNSVYDKIDNGSLVIHQDNTEQDSSYPIITISLGRPMKFITYQLNDPNEFGIVDSNQTGYRIALNLVTKNLKSQTKYGDITPSNILRYAQQAEKDSGNTAIVGTVKTMLKEVFKTSIKSEHILEDGTILVFDGNNRNVMHEIVFDKETDAMPMPKGFPTLSVNKAFSGLGHADRYKSTDDYRVVLTLRKITPGKGGDTVVNENKFEIQPAQQPAQPAAEVSDKLFEKILVSNEILNAPVTQSSTVGICDGTCGVLATRLKDAGMPYGNTSIPDNRMNYHNIAITLIDGKRFILDQPQLEFMDKVDQKDTVWEPALYMKNDGFKFNRHLTFFNNIVDVMGVSLEEILSGEPITFEGFEHLENLDPLVKNIKKEGVYMTATLVGDPSISLRWKESADQELENTLESTKKGEKVFVFTSKEMTPRLIEATEENLMKDYKLSKANAKYGINSINEADINPAQPTTEAIIEIGRYVKDRKGTTYVVTKQNANGTWQVLNLKAEGAQAKKSFSESNLTPIDSKAEVVTHKGAKYLVTSDGDIISLTTNKKMKWGPENGDRKAILAKVQPVVEEELPDIIEDPFTPEGNKYASILDARNNSIDYTQGQEKALLDIQSQMLDTEGTNSFYLLAGYAGTGKTTIAENIVRYGQDRDFKIVVVAPTNKAARVLQQKLKEAKVKGVEAKTIHQFIYGEPDPTTGLFEITKKPVKDTVIIADESSMITKDVMEDLIKNINEGDNNKVIFMGDGFQLEPVGKDSGLFRNQVSEISGMTELTEVRRQALDSTILKIATIVRTLKEPFIPIESTSDFKVINNPMEFRKDFQDSIKKGEDSVAIVATNRERINLNVLARDAKFGKDKKVIENNEVIMAIANSASYKNSEQFIMEKVDKISDPIQITIPGRYKTKTYPMYIVEGTDTEGNFITLLEFPSFDQASLYHQQIMAAAKLDTKLFDALDDSGLINMKRNGDYVLSRRAVVGTYGYAVTAHKSQGSQWDKVFVNQNFAADSWNPARWYYTAITRGINQVNVLRGPYSVTISSDKINEELEKIEKAEEVKRDKGWKGPYPKGPTNC